MKFPRCLLVSTLFTLGAAFLAMPTHADYRAGQCYNTAWDAFQNPDNSFRGKPFWSWNGKLRKEELLRQIEVLEEMGFGGFFMHSRTGLATEYLGEEWFDLINVCADEAEKRNLEAWLYDEDRWPSGSAGGKATEDPRYQMKYLLMEIMDAAEFKWEERFIAAFSCTLEGINYSALKRLDKESSAPGEGRTVLAFSVKPMDSSSFYNGNTYLDTMNAEATQHFIEITHDAYKKHCGDRIGTSIKGIFTDEPHRGMVMCHKVDQGGLSASERCTPWTPALPAAFQKEYGYDLLDHLPTLFLRPEGQRIVRVKWEYMELIQKLFLENFAKPIQKWCRENQMILTGHALHEDTLGAQAVPCGSMMRFYEYMDYPGVDVLTEGNKNYWIIKQLSSVARQLDKKWLLSELYGCTGWQFNFASHKAVGDWQSLLGINLRCHHLSWYTMEGEAKRDFPASIFYQSAWYPEYKEVETYFSRVQAFMSRGEPECNILVLNPVESAWAQIYTGWATWLSATAPEVVALDQKYQQLLLWLLSAQMDFDIGDEDMLARHGKIEKESTPRLTIGKGKYGLVIVSGMETIRDTTLALLEQFQAAGGSILFADLPPAYVNADASQRAIDLASAALRAPFEREPILEICKKSAGQSVALHHDSDPDICTRIFCQSRTDEDLRFIMALNTDRAQAVEGVQMSVPGKGVVEKWDAMTGKRTRIPADFSGGMLRFSLDFPAGGEKILLIRPDRDPGVPLEKTYKELKRTAFEGACPYELSEPNVCVLDRASCSIDGKAFGTPMEILKVDQYVRDHFGLARRGGEMVQPWFTGMKDRVIQGRVTLRYDFEAEIIPETLYLVLEQPDVFQVLINGTELSVKEDVGWWVDTCLRKITLPVNLLKKGENLIEVTVDFHEEINLEALYLLGNFGVKLDRIRRILTDLPDTLAFSDVTEQGLPFYSGAIDYLLTRAQPADEPVGDAFISLPSFEGACAKLCQGKEDDLIAWAPYEAPLETEQGGDQKIRLRVLLTRRNTFGPLHQTTLKTAAYGPGNWVTTGTGFTEHYNLYPAGLLQAPELIVREAI